MFYYVKLVFQSFYDFEAIRAYVRKGEGTGASLMAAAALLAALIAGGMITYNIVTLDKDIVHKNVAAAFEDMPEFIIKDGHLMWQDGVIEKYKMDDDVYITIDTINENPSLKQMRDSAIYITKDEVYLNDGNNNRVQPIAWADVQELANENPMVINNDKVADLVMKIIHYTKAYVIILSFVFVWLWFWLGNLIIAILARRFGTLLYPETGKLEQYERRRLATIAILPPMILFDIVSYTINVPSGWVRWIAVIVIAVILMKRYYGAMVLSEDVSRFVKSQKDLKNETVEVKAVPAAKKAVPKKAAAKKAVPAKKPAVKKAAAVKKVPAKKPTIVKKASAKKTVTAKKASTKK